MWILNIFGENQLILQIRGVYKEKQNYENYLHLYLLSIKKSMKNFFSGSGLKHLNKNAFKSIKVLIPPENIVISFNNFVNPIVLELTRLHVENEELKNLRDFILPLLKMNNYFLNFDKNGLVSNNLMN